MKHGILIDEEVAGNVKHIFDLILERYTLNETAKILNDEGIITARKRKEQLLGYDCYSGRHTSKVDHTIWSHGMVNRIVKNEFYTGAFVFHKTTKSKLDEELR